jgi:hypothetical protein
MLWLLCGVYRGEFLEYGNYRSRKTIEIARKPYNADSRIFDKPYRSVSLVPLNRTVTFTVLSEGLNMQYRSTTNREQHVFRIGSAYARNLTGYSQPFDQRSWPCPPQAINQAFSSARALR